VAKDWIRAWRLQPGSVRLGFRVNPDGFYDRDVPHEPRPSTLVACLADSFGVGVVPHEQNLTTVAERELAARGRRGVELYDISVCGAGPPVYFELLQQYAKPLAPDLVVVALFVGNDLVTPGQARSASALDAWLDRERFELYQLPRHWAAVARERDAG